MQYSTTKRTSTTTTKTMVDMLVEVGVSPEKARNLYNKYQRKGRLEVLTEYIEAKKASQKKGA